ncbi:DUF3098 domain-containing protein [Dysgonomonas sp. 25]|uniref:DUF3098 domain-containing protein n=1 Tax=Dysgonomonas sp. 25 TaxID=2302933 RepID=UPI0013D44B48|nr:DUF3098 domain-containing protein [Dysgonomonas sp. 25]NDV68274.1 DUF3098 domain-containing protein [Dysgonomonas sp. 25]
MNKENLAFGKKNYILTAASVVLIIVGFIVMAVGPSSTIEGGFEPDIFSTRRIVIAPMICLAGFLLMIYAILATDKPKNGQKES